MKLSRQIKPISYLKAHTAEIVRNLAVSVIKAGHQATRRLIVSKPVVATVPLNHHAGAFLAWATATMLRGRPFALGSSTGSTQNRANALPAHGNAFVLLDGLPVR